jgi:hypothetical protein
MVRPRTRRNPRPNQPLIQRQTARTKNEKSDIGVLGVHVLPLVQALVHQERVQWWLWRKQSESVSDAQYKASNSTPRPSRLVMTRGH